MPTSSKNCEETLTVQHRAAIPHELTPPLHNLLGPWLFITTWPLYFFTDGPGHYPGSNEAKNHADVFQYVAFQGTFLFGFMYTIRK